MALSYLGELRLMSFTFAPRGWAQCNGQTLPINQNQALFSLLGTTYGGNGQTTFNLPDLQGRIPMHLSATHPLGQSGGAAHHTLLGAELPAHTHTVQATSAAATTAAPGGNLVAAAPNTFRSAPGDSVALNAASVSPTGGTQPHQNLQPLLTLNWCIALQGIYPSRS